MVRAQSWELGVLGCSLSSGTGCRLGNVPSSFWEVKGLLQCFWMWLLFFQETLAIAVPVPRKWEAGGYSAIVTLGYL